MPSSMESGTGMTSWSRSVMKSSVSSVAVSVEVCDEVFSVFCLSVHATAVTETTFVESEHQWSRGVAIVCDQLRLVYARSLRATVVYAIKSMQKQSDYSCLDETSIRIAPYGDRVADVCVVRLLYWGTQLQYTLHRETSAA